MALELCKKIEMVCPDFGCHVALTGGLLYKEGERKDCDVLFYRIRQREYIDYEGLFKELESIGIRQTSGFGWCWKAEYVKGNESFDMDLFFPEEVGGTYEEWLRDQEGVEVNTAEIIP